MTATWGQSVRSPTGCDGQQPLLQSRLRAVRTDPTAWYMKFQLRTYIGSIYRRAYTASHRSGSHARRLSEAPSGRNGRDASSPTPFPSALAASNQLIGRRVGRWLGLGVLVRTDDVSQPFVFALQGGDPGTGMQGVVVGLRMQGGLPQLLSNQRARYTARGALPRAW
jgi:hypothetical protein